MPSTSRSALSLLAGSLLIAACETSTYPPDRPSLVGTEWRLIEFESSDDAIGAIRPGPEETYTLRLDPDGSAAMTLFCNQGTGRWTSRDSRLPRGQLTIAPMAITMAACPPSRLERIAADLSHVRTFVIGGGRLHLNLMMDGGNYVWIPAR